MLYLISTPIGNLSDISFRAIETLKACDYVLCEDTRHSLPLLQHYEIHKPLKSYHRFNEASQAAGILEDLRSGKKIGLISDAGTPGISDPGTNLVQLCVAHDISVVAIPGACAAIQALSCSGLPTDRFQFIGFLPRKEGEIREALLSVLSYPGTTICYESPRRLVDTLTLLQTLQPQRQVVIARELTKKFEEMIRGTPEQLLVRWQSEEPRGEIVLLIAPPPEKSQVDWTDWTPEEHVEWMQDTYSISRKEAIKLVADLRQVPKRQIYNQLHQD